jgi:glycosyltransferase involved in cell wall biosynthesis
VRIRYVVFNAYAMGGTIRSVYHQANALCADHDVEIASVYRHRAEPRFQLDPRVKLVPLTDLRSDGTRWVDPTRTRLLSRTRRLRTPGAIGRDWRFRRWDPAVELRLIRYFWSDRGILVTTRPGLNLLSARYAPRRLIRVGQDHMNLETYKPRLRRAILRAYPRLDALTVLTERDLADYAKALDGSGLRVERIPNGLPPARLPAAELTSKVLVAAGSLAPQKGFDLLIDAYATVAAKHPEWELWIFGAGPQRADLTAQINRLGLTGMAHLKGQTFQLEEELAASSIFVLSSRHEGLPMVLLEAMRAGLPAAAFDCPTGPAEIIRHGRSGLLVPPEDVSGLAAAICELIEDPDRRRAMGAAAMEDARRYSIDTVRQQWVDLFTELTDRRRR